MPTNKRRYPGIAGKQVSYIETFQDGDDLFLSVRFTDDTAFTMVTTAATPQIKNAELLKWAQGESSVLRTYVKPKGQR